MINKIEKHIIDIQINNRDEDKEEMEIKIKIFMNKGNKFSQTHKKYSEISITNLIKNLEEV